MKMKKKLYSLTLLSALIASTTVYAMSDGIKSNKDDECALYLCVPSGFMSSECNSPKQAFIDRLTDIGWHGSPKWTALPNFALYCNDTSDQNSQYGQSNVSYVQRFDAHIPEHQECTHMAKEIICTKEDYDGHCVAHKTIEYCDAWTTVEEHYVENSFCNLSAGSVVDNLHGYSNLFILDDKGQKIGSKAIPAWCDRHVAVVGVTVDGVIYGDEVRY